MNIADNERAGAACARWSKPKPKRRRPSLKYTTSLARS